MSRKCNINYCGFLVVAVNIFEPSVEIMVCSITHFTVMVVANIYGPDKLIAKSECIGHYQKRVGHEILRKK